MAHIISTDHSNMSGPFIIEEDEDRELLHAEAQIWDHMFNFIKSMSLKCAIQLGIPDAIHSHGSPITLSQLIDALSINASKSLDFERFMRILTHSGFFCKHEGESDAYSLTPSSRLLLKDEPLSVRPLVLAVLDPVMMNPWQNLTEWFRNDHRTAFKTTHLSEFWEYTGLEGERLGCFFNDAMANDSRLVTRLVMKYYVGVFDGVSSLVDVGGGTGTVAKAVAGGFPEMMCTVLDLPHVVAGLEGSKNVTYIAGDMFQFIPPADAILLKVNSIDSFILALYSILGI